MGAASRRRSPGRSAFRQETSTVFHSSTDVPRSTPIAAASACPARIGARRYDGPALRCRRPAARRARCTSARRAPIFRISTTSSIRAIRWMETAAFASRAASRGTRITSSGNINIRGFRYRNLPIGDTRAVWSSARNVVAGALAVGGSEGELHAQGSIGLAPPGPWLSTLERSRFDLDADVGNLDLSLWLPALGMQALPITGRASGQATVRALSADRRARQRSHYRRHAGSAHAR